MMRILHTEASPGWGGQEMRILKEAQGMRTRGHEVVMAVQKGGGLVTPAREAGFRVVEIAFQKSKLLSAFYTLLTLVRKEKIELLNPHSSLDAWLSGIVGKLTGRPVIRTRHLSTPVRPGLNSRLLYNTLADVTVTTCLEAKKCIQEQAKLPDERCRSIPTGVDPSALTIDPDEVAAFREKMGITPDMVLAGTVCVLRGWKGVKELLDAAHLLRDLPHLKWLVVGGGVSEEYFHTLWKKLHLEERVIFTGHLSSPYTAMAALDIFCLLSWANEGVSQASLQAAWLQKPLVTTPVGGLPEVCLEGKTGYLVPPKSPENVAEAVSKLVSDPALRKRMGDAAHAHVAQTFTFEKMLDEMEAIYQKKTKSSSRR